MVGLERTTWQRDGFWEVECWKLWTSYVDDLEVGSSLIIWIARNSGVPPLSWRKQYTIWKTLCQKLQLLGQQKQLLTHYLSSAMTKKPLRSSGFATTTREFVCSLR